MTSPSTFPKRTIGLVGYGALGQFLFKKLSTEPQALALFEVKWVWNRTAAVMTAEGAPEGSLPVPEELRLTNLADSVDPAKADTYKVDIIVEVAHPMLYKEYGVKWVNCADVFVGSPTAMASEDVGPLLFAEAEQLVSSGSASGSSHNHSLFLPSGALWGAQDIAKMGRLGTLTKLHITMRKPSGSFRLEEPLQTKLNNFVAAMEAAEKKHVEGGGAADDDTIDGTPNECVLYDGPVRDLCALAPNNVNTMACAAIASGSALGFDGCRGTLVAERVRAGHPPVHCIEVICTGKAPAGRTDPFEVKSQRYNPCHPTAVTASATYPSFYASLLNTALPGRGRGIFFV